jgi:hypothetical protein
MSRIAATGIKPVILLLLLRLPGNTSSTAT